MNIWTKEGGRGRRLESITSVIRSRRMKWAGHVARMGRRDMLTKLWSENLKGRNHLEDLGVHVRILKLILEK
jgi:hypothetical protein